MLTRKLLFPRSASVNSSFPRPPLTLLVARFLATDTRSLHVRRGERGKKGATREMEIVTRETQTGNIGGTLISRLEKRGGRQTVIVSTSSESLLLLLEREREFFVASINRSETRPSCARILQMVVIVISVKKRKIAKMVSSYFTLEPIATFARLRMIQFHLFLLSKGIQ